MAKFVPPKLSEGEIVYPFKPAPKPPPPMTDEVTDAEIMVARMRGPLSDPDVRAQVTNGSLVAKQRSGRWIVGKAIVWERETKEIDVHWPDGFHTLRCLGIDLFLVRIAEE